MFKTVNERGLLMIEQISLPGDVAGPKSKRKANKPVEPAKSGDFPCTVSGCSKSFYDLSNRKRHERNVHKLGYKEIKCPYCSFGTSSNSGLNNHISSWHPGKNKVETTWGRPKKI